MKWTISTPVLAALIFSALPTLGRAQVVYTGGSLTYYSGSQSVSGWAEAWTPYDYGWQFSVTVAAQIVSPSYQTLASDSRQHQFDASVSLNASATQYGDYQLQCSFGYYWEYSWYPIGNSTYYAYAPPPTMPPAITSTYVSGSTYPGESGSVYIYGSNLTACPGTTSVSIGGGISASVTYSSCDNPDEVDISYWIPPTATPGTYTLTLSTPNGSALADFKVAETTTPPWINGINVINTPVRGASGWVEIYGTDLAKCSRQTYANIDGGITADMTYQDCTNPGQVNISYSIPPGATLGNHSLTVTTPYGTSNAVAFTVVETQESPSISSTSVSGSPVRGGSGSVTIQGTGLAKCAGPSTVAIDGGITASVTSQDCSSPTQITISYSIPMSAALGDHSLTVTTPYGTSNALPFTVQARTPTVTSCLTSPAPWHTGPQWVSITGSGFYDVDATVDGPFITSYNLAAVSDSNIEGTFSIGLIEYPASVTVRAGTVAACAAALAPPAPTIQGLMYQTDTGYADATAGPIYVATGTTVTFQAVSSDGAFPPGSPTWAGSSGASGTGQSLSVTFNSRSASVSDFKTVSATLGNTLTASVIVFDFDGVMTPDDNFESRSLSDFGVGETIGLSLTTTPAISVSDAGGLEWKLVSGGGDLTDDGDGTGSYTVPDSPGAFGFALQIKGGPSKGQSKQKSGTSVAPSGAYQTLSPGRNVQHRFGYFSIRHSNDSYLTPKNVSFRNIVIREADGGAMSASGFLGPYSGTHHGTGAWFGVLSCNANTGCLINTYDIIGLMDDTRTPFAAGEWSYPIAWQYKRQAASDTEARQFMIMTHSLTSDAIGTATSSKGGSQPVSKMVADPTVLTF